MGPADLEEIIKALEPERNPAVIVGPGDDAGVFALDESTAIVETVDVITPVVNDPFTFGAVSAVNSLSDIYAMGGRPLTALAVLGFSSCDYEPKVIKEILRGAAHILRQADTALMGGHSFEDAELKFGLSVTGTIDRARILRASGARPGDALLLTKPIGVGILSTALKAGKLTDKRMKPAMDSMLTLNGRASQAALSAGASAATDVTGFGLLGHAYNMVRGSDIDFEIKAKDIPVFPGVREFLSSGLIPEGAYNNLRFLEKVIEKGKTSEDERLLLCDPQTSGGLLIALPEASMTLFKEAMGTHPFFTIGRAVKGKGRLRLL